MKQKRERSDGTASALLIGPILAQLERSGGRAEPLLRSVGLTSLELGNAERRIPERLRLAIWRAAASASSDPDFGLEVAVHADLGSYDVVDYAAHYSATLREALLRVGRFLRLLSDAAQVEVHEQGRATVVRRVLLPAFSYRHECEAIFALIILRLRAIASFSLVPTRVSFSHTAPRRAGRHRAVFGLTPQFDCSLNEMVFRTTDLRKPALAANPSLVRILDRHANEMLARLPTLGRALEKVRGFLCRNLSSGNPRLADVARACHMSTRTLQREIAARGTTYRAVLEDVRRELALRLLKSELSVTEITFLLGFNSLASFGRVFKRWTGLSPGKFRASELNSG